MSQSTLVHLGSIVLFVHDNMLSILYWEMQLAIDTANTFQISVFLSCMKSKMYSQHIKQSSLQLNGIAQTQKSFGPQQFLLFKCQNVSLFHWLRHSLLGMKFHEIIQCELQLMENFLVKKFLMQTSGFKVHLDAYCYFIQCMGWKVRTIQFLHLCNETT